MSWIDEIKGKYQGEVDVLKESLGSVSDIEDEEGHQYVDIVFEGAGMLGIALVGYTYVLEEVGIRFRGVGGASAGAINAAFLAGLGAPNEKKSTRMLEILGKETKFFDFVDGGNTVKKGVNYFLQDKSKRRWWKTFYYGARFIPILFKYRGLNPGDEFQKWVDEKLEKKTVKDIQSLMKPSVSFKNKGEEILRGEDRDGYIVDKFRLAVVTTDVTTETKTDLPRMARLYWHNEENLRISEIIRASMSIPLFFYPKIIHNIPQDRGTEWSKLAGIKVEEEFNDNGKIKYPESIEFVDGGVMSNFPLDLFHRKEGAPCAPTFGVKVEIDDRLQSTGTLWKYILSLFNAARHNYDYSYKIGNSEYKKLVSNIPLSGKKVNWLDFDMSVEQKKFLFEQGVLKALEFLKGFNWEAYKKTRQEPEA